MNWLTAFHLNEIRRRFHAVPLVVFVGDVAATSREANRRLRELVVDYRKEIGE